MKYKFKVGDKIKCVRPDHSDNTLTLNEVYTVTDTRPSTTNDVCYINLESDVNGIYWWYSDRFELYIKPVTLPDELFEI